MSNGKGSLKAPFFFSGFFGGSMKLSDCFTASDAVLKFKEVAGFDFNPTLAGQILKYGGYEFLGFTESNAKLYSASAWKYLWNGLHFKAYKRACYQPELSYSFGYAEIPPMPEVPLYRGKILKSKKSVKSSP